MRRLFLLSASMACACFLSLFLPDRLPLLLGLAALILFAIARLFLAHRSRLSWLSFGLFFGFSWFALYSVFCYLPSQVLANTSIRLEAVVTQFPSETNYGLSVPVRGGEPGGKTFPLRLYLDATFSDLRPGDRIETIAYCTSSAQIAGRETIALRAKGIYLFAQSYGTVQVHRPERAPLHCAPALLGAWMRTQIRTLYDDETTPLLFALLTGWQSELSDGQNSDFSRSGLSHVVSVSGMHISFLAGALGLLLRRPGKKSALLQIALFFFFAAMTGSGAGAVRAAFLCSAGLLAPLLGQRADSITSLFGALLLLLLVNPFAIAGAGLQFSFAATLGIYLLGQPLYQKTRKKLPSGWGRVLAAPLSILCISLGAMLLTTPLTALYFGQVSFVAPLSNLATNALVAAAFLGGMLSVLVYPLVAPLGFLLAGLTQVCTHLFLWLSHFFAGLPFASVILFSLYYLLFLVFAYAVLLLWLYDWTQGGGRPLLPLCAITIGFCLSTVLSNLTLNLRSFTLTALDVGQGQSLLLSSSTYRALIDCGGTKQAGETAAAHLQSSGSGRLDLLLLTHYHEDHTNGLEALLTQVRVDRFVLPASEEGSAERLAVEALAIQYHIEVVYIDYETTLSFGRATLRVFPPLSRTGDNELGLSLLASYGDWDALITGDMSGETEARLVQNYALPKLELLLLGHHGSRYASSPELLAATLPERALVSVGKNSYGHPAPETLARLQELGTSLYRTDTLGSVTVFAPETED